MHSDHDAALDHSGDDTRTGLSSASFVGLLITQLLTAINDNIFRWLAIGIGKDSVHPDNVNKVLMAGTVCFVLPYLFLAAPAGYLADRFSKRSVIVGCKAAEIVIIALGLSAIWFDSLWLLFFVLTMMGAQAALFSPAKLGSIPEMLRPDRISSANGLFGLMTVVSTVVGMAAGSWLADITRPRGQNNLWISALVLLGVALAGFLFSLLIKKLPAANVAREIPWNVLWQTWRDLGTLISRKALLRVALGMVFFWSVGALAQLNIDQFAFEGGAANEAAKIPLLICLIVGVGVGSILAGVWSCGRVELGILPLGAFGVAVSSMLLFTAQGAIFQPGVAWTGVLVWASVLLFFLGASAGLFSVPLEAFIQHRSPREWRGSILAATNFLVFAGVILSAIVYSGLRAPRYGGSLAQIEPERIGLPLPDEASRRRFEKITSEFSKQWQEGGPQDAPDLKAAADRARPAERKAVLAQLTWIDVDMRRKVKGASSKMRDDYLKIAANEEESLVINAVLQEATNPLFSSRQIFLLFGLLTIPVFVYVVWVIPQASIRFLVWLGSHTIYRIRVFGRDSLPEQGGALLAANHVTWADGVLLLLTSSRPIRMVVFSGNFQNRWLHWLALRWGAIMIDPKRPKELAAAIDTARQALKNGELVCIFPEGGISRTGQIQGFRPGVMKILEGADVPVIPVYLDELWGSVFSFEGGRFFWKWPRRWPYPVSIYFGAPLWAPKDVHQVRRAVQDLGAFAVAERSKRTMIMPRAFLRRCKERRTQSKVADTTGADLKGGDLLLRTLILRRLLRRLTLSPDERYVGVLLPPSVGGVVANAALALDRRIAVNLNYTMSSETLDYCLAECGARRVITSRRFWDKMSFKLSAEVVFLEDFKDKPTLADKIAGAVGAYLCPASLLERRLGLLKTAPDDLMTVIFTSGSTGKPKGVMLTHNNIASNVAAIDQVISLTSKDVLVGILPFFHSLGYTVTLWGVAGLDIKGVYHFTPLDGRQVGRMCKEHGGTCLLSTPTFLRTYVRRCEKEDFATLDVVVTGAERLPAELADAFEAKFGVRPVEGYGTTELSPLVSVNIPASRSSGGDQVDAKEGTVGRPVPGVSVKITDLDSGKELGANQTGMLWVKGPNVMKGYINRPDATSEAIVDGWYKTGDVALIDNDGFIKITGRISRFSKIGGEMVPHMVVEEAICKLIGGDEDAVKAAVTAVNDPKKGERLIVVHAPMSQSPDEICKGLAQAGLPNLFIPSPDSFLQVEKVPVLGTGKVDLRAIQQTASEAFVAPSEATA